jgi:UDP:flavonoid glycosyltransferase YjiC (YdhE family)
VARILDPVEATPASVRAPVSGVLANPGYRQAAEQIQAEFNALPGPLPAVRLLQQLAVTKASPLSG